MRLQRPLALLLSLLIAGQPVLVHAAPRKDSASREHPQAAAPARRERSPELQPVFNLLRAGGYRDSAAEREIEALVGSLLESLPPETIDELASIAALIAGNPGDPAVLDAARLMLGQTVGALPDETKAEIQKLIMAALSMAGIAQMLAAFIKFQQHKDNPSQTPIGTPIMLVFIAAALLFLPSILGTEVVVDDGGAAPGIHGCAGAGSMECDRLER